MNILYDHIVHHISETPSINEISDSLYQLGHEHKINGNIFEMEFTPNRGDCLSLNGLLKDLAVFYDINFNQSIYHEKIKKLKIDFDNKAKDICPKISFFKIDIEDIPNQYNGCLGNYFIDMNLNKNNFFTDISNYLSYETGQPTHCYDSTKINNKLTLHELDNDTEFETLLDQKILLTDKNLVFSLNNKPVNLAGVIGGKSTACKQDTKSVIVECAFFQPEAIIGKSVKYDIKSDASYKFERGVDPECHDHLIRRFIQLVSEHANITDLSVITFDEGHRPEISIQVNVKKINQIIGINITENHYRDYLSKLGFKIKDNFIYVPSHRHDIASENDLAEEVARIIGYNNIPRTKFEIKNYKDSDDIGIENKIKSFFIGNGFYEVINPPFSINNSGNAIKVDNPLDSNRMFLRTKIMDSLLDNLLYNERRHKESVKLFEISDIYEIKNGELIRNRRLSVIASGRVGLNHEDFTKKINQKYLLSLLKKLSINTNFNIFSLPRDLLDTKVKSEIVCLEMNLDDFSSEDIISKYESFAPETFVKYNPISEFPCSYRDISYLIEDTNKIDKLEAMIGEYKNPLVKEVFMFDYFFNQKTNEVKIGYRFILQSKNETLKLHEVDEIIDDIIMKTLSLGGIKIPGLK
jgi:phenylalanyl-tRNA synthetase beta chain